MKIHQKTPESESFLIKLQVEGLRLYEKEIPAQMFSCEILQSLRTDTIRERISETTRTKVCTYIFRNTYAKGKHV